MFLLLDRLEMTHSMDPPGKGTREATSDAFLAEAYAQVRSSFREGSRKGLFPSASSCRSSWRKSIAGGNGKVDPGRKKSGRPALCHPAEGAGYFSLIERAHSPPPRAQQDEDHGQRVSAAKG